MIDRACISLNARCNLNCSYCHFASKKNNSYTLLNEFSIDEIKVFCVNLSNYIINKNINSFKLGIVGAGEPLLSFSSLKTIVEFFANSELKNRIKMYVISNGTLLTEEIVSFFYKNKDIIELNISFDGDEEINKRFRGVHPNLSIYEKYFGKKPKINTVVTKETLNNQDRILTFFVKNNFTQVNFSKVFGSLSKEMAITDEEYYSFLKQAEIIGIKSRQNVKEEKYDCAKYGRLCGVGRNNIFFTRTGVYPCGRFMNLKQFNLGEWSEPIDKIEEKLHKLVACPKGECYFEFNKLGE